MLHLFAHAGHDHPDTEALYTYSTSTNGQASGSFTLLDAVVIFIGIALIILMVVYVWRRFAKAGKSGDGKRASGAGKQHTAPAARGKR